MSMCGAPKSDSQKVPCIGAGCVRYWRNGKEEKKINTLHTVHLKTRTLTVRSHVLSLGTAIPPDY